MRIKTDHQPYRDTRTREHDWYAIDDETYDGPPSPVGVGATEDQAVVDLGKKLGLIDEEPVADAGAVSVAPHRTPTSEELAMLVAWIGTGLIYFLRHEGDENDVRANAARGMEYAERLARAVRDAAAIFTARGDLELGGCEHCSDPDCQRNQPGICWPDDEDGEDYP